MNILYVNTYFWGGGAEKVLRQLYYGIKSPENNAYCIVGRVQKNIPNEVEVIYKGILERAILTIAGGLFGNTVFYTWKMRRAIIRSIKNNNIDIVHFHNLHGNYIGIRDIKKIQKYCPNIVITLHDMWVLTGGCAHAFECEKWKDGLCKTCMGNKSIKPVKGSNFFLTQKKEIFTNNGIHYIAPSNWLKKCCEEGILRNDSITTIYNGISLEEYCKYDKNEMRCKYKLPLNKKIIMFVANGMNNPYKGFDYLKKALEELPQKDKFALIIVGNKQNDSINTAFESYEYGYVENSKMINELYSAADLFILPSVADTLPFTPMESMASGTPVLAFATGGIPEIVSEDCGWICENRCVQDLTDKIEQILSNDNVDEYTYRQIKCRNRIKKIFSEDVMIENYLNYYRDIIKS